MGLFGLGGRPDLCLVGQTQSPLEYTRVEDCRPLCRNESDVLRPLYEEARDVSEAAPCGPIAIAHAMAHMCSSEGLALLEQVRPRYLALWHVGTPPVDVVDDLNDTFDAFDRQCPFGWWSYTDVDDRGRSYRRYIRELHVAAKGLDRAALAVVKPADKKPHWYMVTQVTKPHSIKDRMVHVRDEAGRGEISCASFHEAAAAAPSYVVFDSTLAIVRFDQLPPPILKGGLGGSGRAAAGVALRPIGAQGGLSYAGR